MLFIEEWGSNWNSVNFKRPTNVQINYSCLVDGGGGSVAAHPPSVSE